MNSPLRPPDLPRATLAAWALAGALALGAAEARAATYYVDRSHPACSETGSATGTEAQPYCTITAAANARKGPGVTIVVKAGVYREQIVVPGSGEAGAPFVIRAQGAAIVDGADDLSGTGSWQLVSGAVYLAAGVTWTPAQVFANGARLAASTAAPASLPAGSWRYVSGTGLYVNLGGANPGSGELLVGRRSFGFRIDRRSHVEIEGFTVARQNDRGLYLTGPLSGTEVRDNVVTAANRYGIAVVNGSDLVISGNSVFDHNDHGIYLESVSSSTISGNEAFDNLRPSVLSANGIYLYGCSANRIERNRLHHNQDSGLHFQTCSGNVCVQNLTWANGDHGIDHLATTGTLHVGDVAYDNGRNGISIQSGSTGTSLYDCISSGNGQQTDLFDLSIDASSASGFASDYNLFWSSSSTSLRHAGTTYPSLAAYSAATGLDVHSIQDDPSFESPATGDFRLRSGSPAIDAATSAAPSWPSTDFAGVARYDDPLVTNRGAGPVAFADLGAFEFVPEAPPAQPPVARLRLSPASGVAPLAVVADGSTSTDPDGSLATYRFDFGDGTVVGPQAAATANHTFAAGQWVVTLTVADATGATDTATAIVSVLPQGDAQGDDEPVTAAAYFVDGSSPTASDTGPGTESQPYRTITGAVNARRGPGIVILVKPGVYREQVVVPGSGASGDPYVLRALGDGVVVDGADDFGSTALWQPFSGDVWLAPSVTFVPKQVFVGGARLAASTAAPASLPPNSFRHVSGAGLYVNVGGGNPGALQTLVGRRSYGFRLDRRSWVILEGFTVTRQNDRGIYLTGALSNTEIRNNVVTFAERNGIAAVSCSLLVIAGNTVSDHKDHGMYLEYVGSSTIEENESFRNFRPVVLAANGIYLNGCTNNLIRRNRLHHNQDTGLHFQSCAANTCVQNLLYRNGDHGSDHLSTSGTTHVGDVAVGNERNGFSVQLSSSGISLFDCIASQNAAAAGYYDLTVDPTSTSGFVSDYNLFWTPGRSPVRFDNVVYPTVAAYAAASGRDLHSIEADPLFADTSGDFRPRAGSPAIDAGTSAVAGWTAEDFMGASRFDDPLTPNTGVGPVAYSDLGAFEFRSNLAPVARLTVSPLTGMPPLEVTADASASTDSDGAVVSYTFDFGDGTIVGPQASASASHGFAAGEWTVQVTVTDDKGASSTTTASVLVSPNVVSNSSFESSTTGWNGYAGAAIARVPGGHDGSFSLQMTGPPSRAAFGVNDAPNWISNTVAGQQYRFSAWVRSDNATGKARLQIREYFGAPSVLQGTVNSPTVTLSPAWQQVTADYLVTRTGSTIDFQVLDAPVANSEVFQTDDIAIRLVDYDANPVVTAPAEVTVTEGALLTIAVVAADRDSQAIDSLTADLTGLPAGHDALFTVAPDHRSGTLTWTPTLADAGTFAVTFTAANGLSGSATTSIHVADLDHAPIVTAPASVAAAEGAPLTITVTAADPDSEAVATLAADLSALPAGHGASFVVAPDQRSATLTWTPGPADSGSYTVAFVASNALSDTAITTIHVDDVDRAPVVAAPDTASATEGTLLTVAVTASDPDGAAIDSLTADLSALPAGHDAVWTPAVDGTSGTLAWTPSSLAAPGPYAITFTAHNSLAGSATTSIAVANVDRAPVVSAPGSVVAGVGLTLELDVTASDPDGEPVDSLVADLSGLPAGHGATFTPAADHLSGRLVWTPAPATGPGPFTVRFAAGNALVAEATTSIHVDQAPAVAAPVSVSIQEAEELRVSVTVSDADGDGIDSLSADLSGLPEGHGAVFTINESHTAGTLVWTPGYSDAPGPYTVAFTAGNALVATATTSIEVVNKDRAPRVTAPSVKNTSENLAVSIDVAADDLDGDGVASLVADWSSLPAGNDAAFTLSPDGQAGTFTWTPTYEDSGAYDVTFAAANALSSAQTTRIEVGNADRAPLVSVAPADTAAENQTVTIAVSASDPDGDAIVSLVPDLSALPAGHDAVWTPAADQQSGTLTWTPTYDDAAGPYAIAFTASNALAGSGTTSVTVVNVDRAPAIELPVSAAVAENDTLSLHILVSDPDGEPITSLVADVSALPPHKNPVFTPAPDNRSGTLTWTPSYEDQGGPYPVSFTATNSMTATAVTHIQVSNFDRSPVVNAPVEAGGDEGLPLTFEVDAYDPDGEAITSLTADFSGLPAGHGATFTVNPSTQIGTFTWTPAFSAARAQAYEVTFIASNSFSNYATTAITIRNSDRAPVVTVAASESAVEGQERSIAVTAADPDGEPIASLTADLSGLPAGAVAQFTPAADRLSGTLTWTPGFDDAPGPYSVTFTAANALSGAGTTSIAVANTDRAPVVTVAPTADAAVGELFTLAVTATDPDGDAISALTADLSGLPAGHDAVFTPAADQLSGTLTWTPTPADGGAAFNVSFTATNALTGSAGSAITVGRQPAVTVAATHSGAENDLLTVTVTAADPDGEPIASLTADFAGLPAGHGATFTPDPGNTSGTFTWTPTFDDAPGPYTVTFTAANGLSGSASTSISVTNVDRAPVVTAPATASGAEDSPIVVEVTVADPDGDPIDALVADLSGLPSGVFTPAADRLSGTLTWTPVVEDGPGPFTAIFTATNALTGTASTAITVLQKPVVTAPPTVSVEEGALVTVTVTASDPDGEPIGSLTADLSALPAGHDAVFTTDAGNTTGTLTWTPTFSDGPGTFPVSFTASNDLSQSAATSIEVTNVDRAPVVVAPVTVKIAQERELVLDVTASDPDGEAIASLTADLSGLPAGHNAIFTPAPDQLSGTLTWTPTLADGPGPYPVSFSATNALTGTSSVAVSVNLYPTLTVPASVSAVETSTVIVEVTAADGDGEAIGSLTADLSNLPAGHNATFTTNASQTSGVLIWTPTYDDAPGPYTVSFTASNTLVTTGSTTLSVAQRDRNPVVSAPAAVSGTENAPVTVNVTASDPDGDAIASLTADLSGLPGGQFTPAADQLSGVLTWTPQEEDGRGPFTVVFTAANALSGTASTAITIEQYPVFTAPATASVGEDEELSLTVLVTDPDGDPITSLTADLTGLPAGNNATFTPNASKTSGLLTWRPGFFDAPGPYTVTFTAANGLTRTATTSITVVNADRAPTVSAPATAQVAEGQMLTIQVTADDLDLESIASLTADLTQLPGGHDAVFTPAADRKSGTLTWTPTSNDGRIATYAITFTASNALSGAASTQVKVDQAPEVTAPATVAAAENALVTIPVTANDPDGEAIVSLTADLSQLPAGHDAVFTPAADQRSGTLTWTPTFADFRAAPYTVTFTATNALSGSSSTAVSVANTDRGPVVTVAPTAFGYQGVALTFEVAAADADGDAIQSLSADLSGLPAGESASFTVAPDQRTGTFSWTPTFASGGGPFTVSFTASNALSGSASTSITIDQAPVVSSPASVSGPEGAPLTVTVGVVDPDNDPIQSLTADLSGLPAGHGAVFTTNPSKTSGTLSWTPGYFAAPGPYTVTFTAVNALTRTSTSTIAVTNVDRAPTVSASAAAVIGENSTITLRIFASDPDNEPITSLSADLSQLPAGHDATFTPDPGNAAGTFTWRPTYDDGRPEPYTVTFHGSNVLAASASTAISVESRPVVTAPTNVTIAEGSPVTFTVTAIDDDGQAIEEMYANLSGLPAGNDATFIVAPNRESGVFSWTPTYDDSRSMPYYVTFTASNNFSGAALTAIRVNNTDRAPVVTAPATITGPENGPLMVNVTAADPDGQAISLLTADLSALSAGHNAVFTPNASRTAGTLTWTPLSSDGGRIFPIVFHASNALAGADTTDITVDRYPVLAVPVSTNAVEGAPVSVAITATDPDGQAITSLTADLSALPSGHDAVFTPNGSNTGGTLTWTPSFADFRAAPYNVTFTATNALSRSAVGSIVVANTDRAPLVTAAATATGAENAAFTLTVTAADPDGEALSSLVADLSSLPAGHGATFTVNPAKTSGTLSWTPTFADSGAYAVTFTSANALSGTASTSIHIVNTDRAPVVTAPAAASGPENGPIVVTFTASDPDGDAITSLAANLGALPAGHAASFVPEAGNTGGTLTWVPDFAAARALPYDVIFTATNALTGAGTTAITVTNVDRNAAVGSPESAEAYEGVPLTFQVTASDPDGEPIGSLTANLTALPAGHDATFTPSPDNTSGLFSWTPGYEDAGGPYTVSFAIPGSSASTSIMVSHTDRAPVIVVPSALTIVEGVPLTVHVSAADPEGEAIASLTANLSGLPAGHNATFTPVAGDTAGTLTWTPTYTDAPGPYTVSFTASNVLTGSAAMAISVSQGNQPPVAALAMSPTGGLAPVSITADASASFDPDGAIVSYTFEWGDGATDGPQGSPTATHLYAAGNFTPRVIVEDNSGGRDTAQSFVNPYANLCGNGGFETSTAGWTSFQDSLITRVSPGHESNFALRMVEHHTGSSLFGADDNPNWVAATAGIGSVYYFEAWVRSDQSNGLARLQVREMAGTTVRATVLGDGVVLSTEWQKITVTCTVGFASTSLDLKIINDPIGDGEDYLVDDVLIRKLNSQKPVVSVPATATIAETGTLTLQVSAVDPDGEPISQLTADLSALPAGSNASFFANATNGAGTLTWTPTYDHGRPSPYNVTFTAVNSESGQAVSAITVTEVDRAPIVSSPATLTSGEGAPITVNVTATDPDGQPITSLVSNLAGLPSGHNAVFTPGPGNATGVLTWTPTYDDSGGPYAVTFTATNALSGASTTSIRVTAVDRAPTVTVASRVEAVENGLLELPVAAVDLDGQPISSLTADLSALPSGHGATFTVAPGNASGTFAWTPTSATPHGPFVVRFTADNVKSATAPCTLLVDHYPVMNAPAALTAAENAEIEIALTVSDPDGDPVTALSADLTGLPDGHNGQFTVSPDYLSGVFTWTPTFRDQGGPYSVRFTAVNGHPITYTTEITVTNVDAAPIVTAPSSVTATENQIRSVSVTAADHDGDAITSLTADLSGLPGGHDAVFTPNASNTAGTLIWTPGFESSPGPYHVTFTAANALTGSTKTTIAVNNTDRAPVVTAAASANASEGAPFTYTMSVVDPDNDPITSLTASLSGLPPGHNAVFTPGPGNATGTLTWTPTYIDAVGPYSVTFTAQNALSATGGVSISVQNVDRGPVVTAPIVGGGPEGSPVIVDVTAADPDGAQIFLFGADLSQLPSGHDAVFTPAADNRSGRLTWTPAPGDSARGPFVVTFTASNASSGSASTTLMVGSQDFAPVVSAPTSASGSENSPITIAVQAGDPNGAPITSLSANLSGLPAGHDAVFTPNASNTAGTLTWTPAFADARALPYAVTFTAANSRSGSVTTEITVTNVDRAPTVVAPQAISGADGSMMTIVVAASDPDGQPIGSLTADLSGLPAGHNAVFTPNGSNTGGTLTWTPAPAHVRALPYSIGFTASNALSGSASTAVTVQPRDRAPVFTLASNATSAEGQPLTLTLSVADPDGQAITSLTADLTGLPPGHNAVFTPNGSNTGGTLTWTPTFNDARPSAYNVTFTAANALTATATTAITITNVDRAPVVVSPPAATVIENDLVSINVTASDPDGQAITTLTADLSAFPVGNAPVFTTNAGKTAGTLTWTPSSAEVRGTPYSVIFVVSNAMIGRDTTAITVRADNLDPVAALSATPSAVVPGSEVTLSAAASTDADGSIVSFEFDFGDGATAGPQASPAAPHVYGSGFWTARVIVTDNQGARDTAYTDVVATLTNLVANGHFESALTGWSSNGTVTRTRVAGGNTGGFSMQLRGGSSATALFGTTSSPNPVTSVAGVGRTYRFGAWVKGSTATDTGSVRLEIREFTGTSTQRGVTTFSPPARLTTGWQYVTVDYVVTTAGTNLNVRAIDTPRKSNETWLLDDVTCALVPLGDQAPVVIAPATAKVVRNDQLTVNVTASDPDGQPIASLTADLSGLPAGHDAVFTPNGSNTGGTLTWTPTPADIRPEPYLVVFTASNALSGLDTTAIAVTDSALNLVANPGFETDLSGWGSYGGATLAQAPGGHTGDFCLRATGTSTSSNGIDDIPNSVASVVSVGQMFRFSAWIRSDNSTRAVKLRIYEMAGTSQVGATFYSPEVPLSPVWQLVTVDYTARQAGTSLSLRITNYPTASGEIFFIDDVEIIELPSAPALLAAGPETDGPPAAEPQIRRSTPRAFTTEAGPLALERDGTWSVQVEGVDGAALEGSLPAIELRANGRAVTADPSMLRMGDDTDANGFEEIGVTLPMEALRRLLGDAPAERAEVSIVVGAATPHERSVPMTLELTPLLRFEASFGPNPMRAKGTLFFSITRTGPVLAEVFDAGGRRVRTLVNEPAAKPGRFAIELDGRGNHGEQLPAGMYFYRVSAAEGRLGGRFVIVR